MVLDCSADCGSAGYYVLCEFGCADVTDKSTSTEGIRTMDPQFCVSQPTELKGNSHLLLPVGALYTNTATQIVIGNQLKTLNKKQLSDLVQTLVICILIHNTICRNFPSPCGKVLTCPHDTRHVQSAGRKKLHTLFTYLKISLQALK